MNLIKPSFSTGYAKNASESANPNLWKGLVGAWMPSLGVTGNTLKDVSGNGNDGTLEHDTSWKTNDSQRSLYLDGVQDHVSGLGDISVSANKPFTITARVKLLSFADPFPFVCQIKTDTQYPYAMFVSNASGYLGVNFGSANTWVRRNSNVSFDLNKTQTISLTYNGNGAGLSPNFSLYLNGKSITNSPASPFAALLQNNYIGTANAGSRGVDDWNGYISNFRIYNRALSPTEIKQLYLNPSAPFERKKQTVVRIATPAPAATTKTISVKKPKPSYATGYARNASESANPNLWKGLVGAWMPSFGVTGREVVEVSGRNDNLVSQEPTDHIEWITGKHGKAFSTIDYSYADGGDVSAYIEEGLTVSGYFWMGRNGGTKMIVGQWGAGGVGNASWLVDCVGNKVVARTYNGSAGSAVNSTSYMRYQEWQHVACVWNFNTSPFTATIYFDGRYDAAGSFSNSIFPQVSTNYKVHVGTYPPSISSSTRTNLRWAGHYGDFTIHNRALSPTEIKQLYLNPTAPFERKAQNLAVPAAQVTPSGVFNPFSVLSHPLEQ